MTRFQTIVLLAIGFAACLLLSRFAFRDGIPFWICLVVAIALALKLIREVQAK